ncbi:MAG: hypothetical protein ABJC74_02710 [Gemmatimonadota bacterium]
MNSLFLPALSGLSILSVLSACSPAKPSAAARGTPTVGLLKPTPASEYQVRIPPRWAGLYRLDTLSTQERGNAPPGAIQYAYLPQNSTQHSETLIAIVVYDSAAWAQVRAEGGPPPGDSVAQRNGRIYIVALPQSNPFASGTADSTAFQALELTADEAAHFVVLPQ